MTTAATAPVSLRAVPRETYDGVRRLVVLGDLHGDLDRARLLLRCAGVVDARDRWTAEDGTVVVQVGDMLDDAPRGPGAAPPGPHDMDVLLYMYALCLWAARHGRGCACVPLVGNHELMNVAGDLSYVSPASLAASAGPAARRAACRPGGYLAQVMASHMPAVVRVNDVLCAHAGLTPGLAAYGLGEINATLRAYLTGAAGAGDPHVRRVLFDPDTSVLWSRRLADPAYRRRYAAGLLEQRRCRHMVVGHTVQPGGIAARDGVVFVDTGISGALAANPQALDVRFDAAGRAVSMWAIRPGRDNELIWRAKR